MRIEKPSKSQNKEGIMRILFKNIKIGEKFEVSFNDELYKGAIFKKIPLSITKRLIKIKDKYQYEYPNAVIVIGNNYLKKGEHINFPEHYWCRLVEEVE